MVSPTLALPTFWEADAKVLVAVFVNSAVVM